MADQPFYSSLLFVPVTERFLSKPRVFDADALIFDLEDSLHSAEKSDSVQLLCRYLSEVTAGPERFVRLNMDSFRVNLEELNRYPLTGYVIPKVENREIIEEVHQLTAGRKLIYLFESPVGILQLEKMVLTDRVIGFAFGAEDYSSSMGRFVNQMPLDFARNILLLHGHAHKRQVFDTVDWNFRDLESFRDTTRAGRDMGFTGKMAIHPAQVAVINEVYDDYDYDEFAAIIDKFTASGQGLLEHQGRIYESVHIRTMEQIIRRRRL